MDIELDMDFLNSSEKVILKDGGTVDVVSDNAMDFIYRKVCEQIPNGHTVFKNYDPVKKEWTLELFDQPRDYKNEAIWRSTFVLMRC